MMGYNDGRMMDEWCELDIHMTLCIQLQSYFLLLIFLIYLINCVIIISTNDITFNC